MISVVTAAHRGDLGNLARTAPEWAREPLVGEIIVAAWEGARSRELLAIPKLALVEIGADEPFAPGLARNLGIAAAGHDILLALDPEVLPRDPGGALPVLGASGAFVTIAGGPPGREAAQSLFRRVDWERTGGFHEWLVGRGFDGEDFAERLGAAGLAHRFFGPDAFASLSGGGPLPAGGPDALGFALPASLWRAPTFVADRNRILGGLAPWNQALASLRPRRLGGAPGDRVRRAILAPRPPIERRLLDWCSFIAARFGHDLPEEAALVLLEPLLAGRAGDYRARAERQNQIACARAALGITEPWR